MCTIFSSGEAAPQALQQAVGIIAIIPRNDCTAPYRTALCAIPHRLNGAIGKHWGSFNAKRKNTMKTDAQLQQDVIAELKWEPSINAAQIGVEVKGGVVTLAGHVDTYAEKCVAERAAQRVSGVKALAVEMDVKLAGSSARNDTDIASSAESALRWTTFLPKDRVKVTVESGWITLSGNVDWAYQREAATDSVRYLMGVKGVSDQIAIKPKASMTAVKADIEAALQRRAKADAKKISVDINGGVVTLTGTVQSWTERDLARQSAWGTSGVSNVIDNITVAY